IAGQTLAALFLLWDGVGVDVTRPLLAPIAVKLGHPFLFGEWFIYITSAIVVVGIVVACCNASNLMDGLDGLCGGVTAVISGGFLFLAVHLAVSSGGLDPNLDAMRVVIAIAL